MHPIHRLLDPHFKDTMHINALARSILINSGGILEKILLSGDISMELSSEVYKEWRFDQQGLPDDLIKRYFIQLYWFYICASLICKKIYKNWDIAPKNSVFLVPPRFDICLLKFLLVNILVSLIKYLWDQSSKFFFFFNLWMPWEKATSILIHSNFYTIIFWYQTFMAKFLQRHGHKRFKSHWSSAPFWGLSLWSRWTWDMDRHQDLGHRFLLNLL